MTSSTLRASALLLIASTLALSSCASNSDRRGASVDAERGERGQRQARASGTFLQPAAALFAGMDINRDKVLTRSEMLEGVKYEWESFGGRNPSATKFSDWSMKTLGSTDAYPSFMSFDRDFNQAITKTEFSDQMDRLFTRYDKNGDGKLERSEMIITFEAPRGRGRSGNREGRRGSQGGGQRGGQGDGQRGRRPQR